MWAWAPPGRRWPCCRRCAPGHRRAPCSWRGHEWSEPGLASPDSGAAGVAFGGRARSLLQPLLMEAEARGAPLREQADLRRQALDLASGLVDPWRQRRWLEQGPDAPSP